MNLITTRLQGRDTKLVALVGVSSKADYVDSPFYRSSLWK